MEKTHAGGTFDFRAERRAACRWKTMPRDAAPHWPGIHHYDSWPRLLHKVLLDKSLSNACTAGAGSYQI